MELINVKIYVASNSFLYLPAYIADDLEILTTILEQMQNNGEKKYHFNVEFVPFNKNKYEGDEGAIYEMIKENQKSNTVAIAIGSPVAFLGSKKLSKAEIDSIRVVGAIVNKLTLWAVAEKDYSNYIWNIKDFNVNNQIENIKKGFDTIIYPNKEYITLHYLGKKIEEEANIKGISSVEFGSEIDEMKKHKNSFAITANIVALAKALASKEAIHINYSFSEHCEEFLTVGIITSKKSCELYSGVIEKIIDSIQTSIAILYSSKKTAAKYCAEVAKTTEVFYKPDEFVDEDSDSIKRIVELIYKEGFYPKQDLSVTKECWSEAVKAFTKAETEEANVLFEKHVNNSFVLRLKTKRISLDLDSSRNNAFCKRYSGNNCSNVVYLEKKIDRLKKRLERERYFIPWLWHIDQYRNWLMVSLFILIVGTVLSQYFGFIEPWVVILISLLPTLIPVAIDLKEKKKNEKSN